MEQDTERAHAAEQRAFAVAKLKRAASLPRMKDGRRPPMHVEGVSEGERSEVRDMVDKVETETETLPEPKEQVHKPEREREREREQEQEQTEEVEMEVEIEEKPEELLEEGQRELLAPTPEPSQRKRRPRSRSRSRNSVKAKAKALQSPTPSPLVRGTDSSRDDSPTPPPNDDLGATHLISPVPSRLAEFQQSQLLMMNPAPASPEPNMFYPGTSPPTPMLPSLEAIQKGLQGLQRSNSAAARMMAMHKLTGGTDTYDNRFSPSPTPQSAMLGRNNTVSGGERSAVRKLMLNRLRERIGETDDNQTSASEELTMGPITPKRRRRRSRKGSMSASTNPTVSDLDASTDTPSMLVQPSLSSLDAFPSFLERSMTPNRPYTPQTLVQRRLAEAPPTVHAEQEKPKRRWSLVVEDDDPVEQPPLPQARHPGLLATPQRLPARALPVNVPSSVSSDSGIANGSSLPFYLSNIPPRHSPFGTPLKEKASRDEDGEEVLYQARYQRVLPTDAFEREISWVALPVPKLPLDENEDGDEDGSDYENEDDDERPPSTHSSKNHSSQAFDDSSQQDSVDADANQDYDGSSIRESKEVIIESEVCLDTAPSFVSPSPSSVAALSQVARVSDDSTSPQVYPARLSIASRLQSERSPLNTEFSDYDESRASAETPTKREKDSPGTWEKMKRTLSRNGSTSGRRSRTNSLSARERREQVSSGISRESGASIGSTKIERVDSTGTFSQQGQGSLITSSTASTSMMSVAPPPRGGASPIPPATSADMLKYQSTKLFPFPGIEKLKEQRKRQIAGSSSTPDVTLGAFEMEQQVSGSSSNTPAETPPGDRKLSHQASDTRLIARFNAGSPQISSTPSNSSQPDYFNKSSPQSLPAPTLPMKLPMNRAGVKQWLSAKKLFSSQPSNPSSPQSPESRSPTIKGFKKPSLSDLLLGKKDGDLTDWEEIGSDKSRTPTSATSTSLVGKHLLAGEQKLSPVERNPSNLGVPRSEHTDTEKTPRARKVAPFLDISMESDTSFHVGNPPSAPPSALPSPPPPSSSVTPDPVSSLEDYPPHSTSESSSNTSSQYSNSQSMGSQGAIVLERLDDMLGRGSRSPMWAAAVEDPPRKLLLSSPVLQVVNANTVKDRFLFLFSDLLVITKPIIQDHDNIVDCYKPNPLDRKFIVKSAVLLRSLKFSPDREEPQAKTASFVAAPQNPAITSFVRLFAKDPEHAVNSLLRKAGTTQEATALIGHLLFKTLDLDRALLGEYLSRRSSKILLKSYVDEFGFTGMRVDKALRVFLLSLNVPSASSHNHSVVDYLADAFASRWYEANASIVAYDKDLAIRLVRAVVQLNEVLHGGVTSEAGPTSYPNRNVTSRDFVEAFRRYDARGLVSDELLDNIYAAIRRERLAQANGALTEIPITIKRSLPSRLTYRIQSEPIILRIPQSDPHLTIQLYGQDLVFDPPSLTFAKSNEASFRITGTSLGAKKMIMWRSGPSALKYSSLPLSNSLAVERAFMRNTFQVAFSNHIGAKRRYMFSVDDPLIRHQWSVSLKRQIDIATALADASGTNSPSASKFHRAAEIIAFKVLQETLMGPESLPGLSVSTVEKAVQKLGASARSTLNGGARFTPDLKRGTNNRMQEGPSHNRSKSRSQMYHRHGAGKLELELNRSGGYNSSDDDEENRMAVVTEDDGTRPEGKLWSGRDLELHCQQNSSIALVLAFLQVGSPDREQGSS